MISNLSTFNLKRKQVCVDMLKINNNFGLYTRNVHGIVSAHRVAANDRKLFEPNFKTALHTRNPLWMNTLRLRTAKWIILRKQ